MQLCILTATGKLICYSSPNVRVRAGGTWGPVRELVTRPQVPPEHQAVINMVADLLKAVDPADGAAVDPTQQFAIFHTP
jgi:hypothetical protein